MQRTLVSWHDMSCNARMAVFDDCRAKIEGASPDKRRRLSPAPELALPLPPACPPVADAAVAAAPLPWPSCGLNLLPGHLQVSHHPLPMPA